ncbi:MAG: energy-coupling factor transporter transmembrane protein EcfT, partial [Coriobacteriia bacterium]|nr:energy-coupling factor transporter transmembrane protein EcfT [Coriobacteriia bacterium]
LVALLYFVAVIALTMSAYHPVIGALSVVAAVLYLLMLKGVRALLRLLALALIITVVMLVVQFLTVHLGKTALFTVGYTRYTLEALVAGFSMTMMLVSVIFWFSCYQEAVGSDRFMAVFSRILPTSSMMVSMVFNYVPGVLNKSRQVNDAHKAIAPSLGEAAPGSPAAASAIAPSLGEAAPSLGEADGTSPAADRVPRAVPRAAARLAHPARTAKGLVAMLRWPVRLSSILMGWSMETGLITAASMRARGYGAQRRTSYLPLFWSFRDSVLSAILVALVALAAVAVAFLSHGFAFYPGVSPLGQPWQYLPVAAIFFFPLIYEGGVRLKWQLSSF